MAGMIAMGAAGIEPFASMFGFTQDTPGGGDDDGDGCFWALLVLIIFAIIVGIIALVLL